MLIRYFLCVALALFFATILRLKKAFFKNFAVGQENEAPRLMSIGGDGEAAATCAACGNPGAKKCSRCKSVSYCSKECQSKHWEADHSLKCKKLMLSDEIVLVSSGSGAFRRKASGFSPIALVPAGRTCKVLQCSKKILFSYNEFVKLFNWDKPGFPPCGLINNGNSCFANVVLQCLACTRPLIAYFLEKDHSRECIKKQSSWCLLCELQTHFERASGSLRPFQPINILSRMSSIGGNLGYGRQEDAHEFMRFVINTMQSDFLYEFGGEKSLDPSTQETTLIQHIFGGLLQSQVICTKCNTVSSRYENMMDLTVEIQGEAQSLEKCLEQFTVKEWLDGENMYKCDGCNAYVKACKQLTVNQAPNILTIALKRFETGMYGKLNKTVTFPMNLDLTPYMSETGDGTDLYKLYAVIVHVDLLLNASYLGHYICYIKDYHGHWYRINDSMVTVVDEEVVLAEDAYMLLYSRRNARQGPLFKPLEPTKKQQLAEVDPESSSISNAMVAVSSVQHLPPDADSQSNHSTPEKPMDISLLRDMQQESELSTKISTGRENGSRDLDLVVPVEVNPVSVCQDLGFVDLDDPKISYSRSRDVDEDKPGFFSVVTEDDSPLEPMQCNLIPPAMLSSVEAYALECQVSPVSSDGDCHMEEDRRLSSNTENTCEIIVHKMAETSTAPITALSSELETIEDLRQKPEHSVTVCGTSGFSNGVIWVDDASLPAAHKETQAFPLCLENSLREKTKPFLGSPPRSKLLDHEATPQIEKVYSYSGHAKHLESFHRNGRSTIPSSESSFLSPGFLNKCYKRSLNKSKIAKEPNKPNRPCKTNFNGHEMSCLEGKSQLSAGCKGPSLPTCHSLEGLGSLRNRIKD